MPDGGGCLSLVTSEPAPWSAHVYAVDPRSTQFINKSGYARTLTVDQAPPHTQLASGGLFYKHPMRKYGQRLPRVSPFPCCPPWIHIPHIAA